MFMLRMEKVWLPHRQLTSVDSGNRLWQNEGGAGGESLPQRLNIVLDTEHHHDRVLVVLRIKKLASEFDSVRSRHANKNHVEPLLLGVLLGLLTIVQRQDPMTERDGQRPHDF